jgi:hypothetical protein
MPREINVRKEAHMAARKSAMSNSSGSAARPTFGSVSMLCAATSFRPKVFNCTIIQRNVNPRKIRPKRYSCSAICSVVRGHLVLVSFTPVSDRSIMPQTLDYEALQEAFVFLLVLAFFIERSLAVVFELRLWRGPLAKYAAARHMSPSYLTPSCCGGGASCLVPA